MVNCGKFRLLGLGLALGGLSLDVLSCPSLDKPEAFGYHGECFPADTLSDAAILTCRSKPSAAKVRRRTTCLAFWRLLAFANPRLAKGSKGPVWDGPVHFLGTDNQKQRGLQELVFRLCFKIFFLILFLMGGWLSVLRHWPFPLVRKCLESLRGPPLSYSLNRWFVHGRVGINIGRACSPEGADVHYGNRCDICCLHP